MALKYGNDWKNSHSSSYSKMIHRQGPLRPDLNPLDYSIWGELMDWTQISTKQDLIDELRQATKSVVFESCNTCLWQMMEII